jgi:hypothetical protein
MDKQLLKALDNLYFALDEIAEALNKGKAGGAKSSTANALVSSNLEEHFKEINVSLKSIKSDTQEILKNQKTLLSMSKNTDKKTGVFEEAGGDKKSESKIKQGVGTILLIAVAVLAIGLAFKIVGKVDFLSVIALSISIVLVAIAFEKIAKLELTPRQAIIASAVMVIGSLGIMISSYILSKIAPVSMTQMLTAAAITLLFLVIAPAIAKMIKAMTTPMEVEAEGIRIKTAQMDMGTVIKSVVMLPLLMVGMSVGITLSSMILKRVVPISIPQALTAVLIAVMFAMAAKGMAGLITALTTTQEASGAGFGFKTSSIGVGKMAAAAILLPFIMVGIAIGITLASRILTMIRPIGIMQAITAILIAGMFAVVASGISKLITATKDVGMASILLVPILMLSIAGAIAGAAFIFFKAKPYFDGLGFLTILKILLVGATMGIISILAAYALKTMKSVTWGDVLKLPTLFTLLSLAVATSAFILYKAKPYFDGLDFMTILKILALGAVIGVITIIAAIALKILGQVSWGSILKLPVLFTLISLALAGSAFILMKAKASFDKMNLMFLLKLVVFGIVLAIAVVVMGLVVKLFNMIGVGVTQAIKGGIVILILVGVIAIASNILAMGNYKKYPDWKWALGVSLALGAFGVGAVLLGTQVMNPFFYAGLGLLLLVSGTIVAASHILNAGKYGKYPKVSWAMGVGLALGAFGLGAVLLGFNVLNPFFYPGLEMISDIAQSIVDVSIILTKGKYKNSITKEWAESISISLGAFSQVYDMLADSKSLFGGGPSPSEFSTAIVVVSKGITTAAEYFNKHTGAFKNGPPLSWAQAVGTAIGAFAPVFKVMENFPFTAGKKIARAMVHVADAVIRVALHFDKYKGLFSEEKGAYPSYEWSQGVGEALNAFSPVFKALSENDSWFTSGEKVVDQMKYGIVQIAYALTSAAIALSMVESKAWKSYPSVEWAKGVGDSINEFMNLFDSINKRGYSVPYISMMSSVLSRALYSLSSAAKVMYKSKKYFSFKISIDWMKNLSKNVLLFGKTAQELDKLLGFDEKKSTKSGGFMGVGESTTTTTVRKMKDLSVVTRLVYQMAQSAGILWSNRKFFSAEVSQNIKNFSERIFSPSGAIVKYAKLVKSLQSIEGGGLMKGLTKIGHSFSIKGLMGEPQSDAVSDMAKKMVVVADILYTSRKLFDGKLVGDISTWFKGISSSILGYVALNKWIKDNIYQKVTKTYGFKSKWLGDKTFKVTSTDMLDLSLVPFMAEKLVDTAAIISKGNFNQKIDPFYMRKIGQNLIDFTYVVKKIAEAEGKGTSFLGRLGSTFEGAIGTDPVSQIARRMITLAKGYDAMANALIKLGFALKTLNIRSLSQLGSITKSLSTGQPIKNEIQQSQQFTGRKFGEKGEDRPLPVVVMKKKTEKRLTPEMEMQNNLWYVSQRLEETVDLLRKINKNTQTIDEYIEESTNGKIKATPDIELKDY